MAGETGRNQLKIDVVAFMDRDGNWIAQGIQYDIAARAPSPLGLREAFQRQLLANLALNARLGREGLDGVPPAPDRFRALFEAAKEQLISVSPPAASRRGREEIDMRLAEAA
jgi:hypothetical protein